MNQALLFIGIHVVGLAVCMAIGPRRAPALACALAFPVGLALSVLLALALLMARAPYEPHTLGAAMAILTAGATIAAARRGLTRGALVLPAVWTTAFAIGCVVLGRYNVANLSYDSFKITSFGLILASDGGLDPSVLDSLANWGVFQVIVHSLVMFTELDFLYGAPVVMGLSFIPVFALALWHGLLSAGVARRHLWLAVALVTAALFSSGMVLYHVLYIHTNFASAIYLFCFVTCFWLAELEQDSSWLPIAFIALTAFALQRTEAPLMALVFAALAMSRSLLPRAPTTRWLAAFTAVVCIWYEFLAQELPGSPGEILTPTRCRILWASLASFFLWRLVSGTALLRRVDRMLPAIVGGATVLALVGAFATKREAMLASASNWAINLGTLPHWGYWWYAIAFLVALSLFAKPPKARQTFAVGIPVFFGLVLCLSYFRIPYRLGIGDSANRMTIHVVPLILYYLALKLMSGSGAGAAEAGAAEAGAAEAGAPIAMKPVPQPGS